MRYPGIVAGQHRNRIHAGFRVTLAEPALEPRRKPPHVGQTLHLGRAKGRDPKIDGAQGLCVSEAGLVARVLGKEVDLHPGRADVLADIAVVAPRQRPVVG